MAGTNRSLRQILDQAQAHIMTAAVVLAQLRARRAIKDQLRKQWQNVSLIPARDISAAAHQYLVEHRAELMPDAIESSVL